LPKTRIPAIGEVESGFAVNRESTIGNTLNCVELCAEEKVPTNLAIDDRLIAEAQKVGDHCTKKEAVNAVLDECVRRRKQQKIVSLFGTIDCDATFDYRRERRKRV
jgi:hypothetical protein